MAPGLRESSWVLVDYLLMRRAYSWSGRAIALAFASLFFAHASAVPALAQQADPDAVPSGAFAATALPPPRSPEIEIDRAEALFVLGSEALSARREAEAREAFDAALDVFVSAEAAGLSTSSPRRQAAYQGLIDRIHSAEVAAGAQRLTVPVLTSLAPGGTSHPTAPAEPLEPPAESTLADLGNRIEALTPTDDERLSTEAVLGTEHLDLPIKLNDQVLGAIGLYTGKFRDWFSRALSRGLPHLPRIREIFAEVGIPEDLAYVPIVESAFNPLALSRAKARGLWQFIPSTGKQYGLRQDFFVDERANLEKATLAAAQYLKTLYAMFGDWNLALAGYNAGEGNVLRAIRRARTNDFWALARTRSFRAETKNYVPLIHAAIVIAKSPGSYGIDLSPSALTAVETVRVTGSYPITTVARCASALPADINLLNPDLRRGMTPSSAFDLKVPHGSAEQVTACLAGERAMEYTRHVVRKRDTFSLLAKMFGVPSAEIARVNGLTISSRLKPGTELAVPRRAQAASSKTTALSRTAGGSGGTSYRIQKGDTLSGVAARHSTTVDAIKALNGLSTSRLSIGQVIRLASWSNETSPE